METIRNYLETMFSRLPDTPEFFRLKEEMLGNMEEKYQELKAEGKSENEAVGTVIGEFGNIEELLLEMGYDKKGRPLQGGSGGQRNEDFGYEEGYPYLSKEQADQYLSDIRVNDRRTAVGIALILLGCANVVGLSSVLEFFHLEGVLDVLPVLVMFVFMIPGIAVLIFYGHAMDKYRFIKKGWFRLDRNTREMLEEEAFRDKGSASSRVALGVVLCIAGVVPVIGGSFVGGLFWGDPGETLGGGLGSSLLLLFVAMAVMLFITADRQEGYKHLLRGQSF